MTAIYLYFNPTTKMLGGPFTQERRAAEGGMTVIADEATLGATEASIAELVRFYNMHAPVPVKTFRDRPTAVRRAWAAAAGSEIPADDTYVPSEGAAIVADVQQEIAAEEAAMAPEAPAQKSKRGRKAGTGEFAGKTVFATKDANPRRIGTAGFKSYEIIRGKKDGVAYADFIAAGGRPNDLRWDIAHKYASVK